MSKAKTSAKKKRTPVRKSAAKSAASVPAKIPQSHGGALYSGGVPGNPGGGRPPDEVRRAYRELGATKGFNLVDSVLDGNVRIRFYGMCPHCHKDSALPEGDALEKLLDEVGEAVRASVDQQLKANEQALKYGLGTKDEIDVSGTIQKVQNAMAQALAENVAPGVQQRILERMAELVRG